MSKEKNKVRSNFRKAVFERDGNKCKFCSITENLDAHHINDRSSMPNGGYVLTNGISLCQDHHKLAEIFHSTGTAAPGFSPEDLYKIIGSSYEKALAESERLP